MRIIKFAGTFLAVAGILLGFIFYVNWDAFRTVYENRDSIGEGSEWVPKTYSIGGLVDYIQLHPEQVSIVSFPVDDPDKGIYYGADIPRVYGSAGIALLLGEFYNQSSKGVINPDSLVHTDSIGLFVIKGIEENSFRNAVREAGKAGLIDSDGYIRLEDLFYLNMVKGNLHAHDYLLTLLGDQNMRDMITGQNLTLDAPIPFTGLYLMSVGGIFNRSNQEQLHYLKGLNESKLSSEAWNITSRYISDVDFRAEVNEITERRGLNLTFIEMRELFSLLPKAAPVELASMMKSIRNGDFLSEDTSDRIFDKLKWPGNKAIIRNTMEFYAAAYDNRMGMLNGVDTGRSIGGDTDMIQVVMFQNLPIAMWMHMSSNFINQELQRLLITDTSLFDKTNLMTDDLTSLKQVNGNEDIHTDSENENYPIH